MTLDNRTKLGIALAVAVLAGLASVWIAVLLLVLAAFLIVWGQVPERTEEFVGRFPCGNYLRNALARIDLILWPPVLGQKDLVEEELVKEEYFRAILRGYSPLARQTLRQLQLRTTGDPKSVLDEEWAQYFKDGLVETTHSGRGGVRPELRELIGRLLDEFHDSP